MSLPHSGVVAATSPTSPTFAPCFSSPAPAPASSDFFVQVVLFTAPDGRACFRETTIALDQGTPAARLSAVFASGGYQLRQSPVGFRSQFHCTEKPQWVFILSGQMGIGLQDGSLRVFQAGQHFYSADTLPAGARFDPTIHGHWSCQIGQEPLITLFIKDSAL